MLVKHIHNLQNVIMIPLAQLKKTPYFYANIPDVGHVLVSGMCHDEESEKRSSYKQDEMSEKTSEQDSEELLENYRDLKQSFTSNDSHRMTVNKVVLILNKETISSICKSL